MAQPGDRAYTILLSHLHKPTSPLPLDTLQSLITHFLSRTATPSPLCATVISAPLFRPFSHAKLTSLTTAFRHAVHARLQVLKEEPKSLLTQSLSVRLNLWARAVVAGLNGGQGVIRLVGAGGVLLGLDDLRGELSAGRRSWTARGRAEDEAVIALAEVMDVYGAQRDDAWEKEFRPETEHGEADVLSLSLLFACQFTSHIDRERLTALPLRVLVTHLMHTVEHAFMSGRFLQSLASSCSMGADQKLSLASDQSKRERPSLPYGGSSSVRQISQLSIDLRTLSSSTVFTSIPLLSRTVAQILPLLVETRPQDGWEALEDVLRQLKVMASAANTHWSLSPLSTVKDSDNLIAADSKEIAKTLWNVLKYLLFATVMVSQACLTSVVYARQPPGAPSAESLALLVLDILQHLSIVAPAGASGFAELKKLFYTALDILSADPSLSDEFVRGLSRAGSMGLSSSSSSSRLTPYQSSLQSVRLSCIEQLVPVLSPSVIESHVFPLCSLYLNDSTDRDVFENAHSVVLALFAAHARKHAECRLSTSSGPVFIEKLVPFYAQCLLENSAEDKLNTPQLRLAYASLVSSAAITSESLAFYCLLLLDDLFSAPTTDAPRRHRLHLTFVSTLSSLSLHLLVRALERIRAVVAEAEGTEREEIVNEVFKQIMEGVGDGEKEYAMRWWVENEKFFQGGKKGDELVNAGNVKRKGKEVAARL
ncbi:hypothetical protein K488DRAFT_82084 [Vararia minispora EC-137]|uniref:Uncharacterized protein n=1 Tax=Vararia minispora EC-137 TaxID=1314806 RepID=A0ACB8QYX9_9AGAM|nr:hypothetical protein K488DRAFT_82084 [Vararia minispora EC-137]